MPNPILSDSDTKLSAAADNTTLVSKTFASVGNNDVFVVMASTWDSANGMAAPTGGGQTFTQIKIAAPGGFNGWAGLWVCAVSGSPGSFAVSCAPGTAGNTRHSLFVTRWTSAKLAGSPATNATVSGAGAPSANITTAADNSALVWVECDVASVDPSTRTYRLSGTEIGIYDGHVGANSVQSAAYAFPGVAGTYAVGESLPTGQTWVLAGVEVQYNAPAGSEPGGWGTVYL